MALTGDVALITGGGRGVGRGISQELASRGAPVAVLDLDEDVAIATAKEIVDAGGKAIGLGGNVLQRESLDNAVERVQRELGTISILVNNAGTWVTKRFIDSEKSDWDLEVGLNYYGVLNATQAVLPGMIDQNYGRIISISSDAGRVGQPTNAVYSGAKAAVNGFTRALAKEVGRFAITANIVSLSVMQTRQTEDMLPDEEAMKKIVRGYAIRRVGRPEDAANGVAFFADRASEWVTGQTLGVNGGYAML